MCLVSLSSIGGESNQLRFNKTDSADITVTEGIKDNCAEGNEKISRETLEGMIAAGNDVTGVCTSLITDMSRLFFQNKTFNQDISGWDVSNVVDFSVMFNATDAFNQPLNNWDTSSAKKMNHMFAHAASFNQPLDNWNTSGVTTMASMFHSAKAFDQDISGWDTSQVTDFSYMLAWSKFSHDISKLNTSSAIQWYFFSNANSLLPLAYIPSKFR